MSKLEKRLILFAVLFVVIYLGAAVLTLRHRYAQVEPPPLRYESEAPTPAEGRLGMVELLPPMLVLLTLAITFAVVKKRRAEQLAKLDESDDGTPDAVRSASPSQAAEDLRTNEERAGRADPRHR